MPAAKPKCSPISRATLGNYLLSPDGKTVAFTGYEPPADEDKNKKEKRDWRVVDANPTNMAIYVIPVEANADGKRPSRKLTDGKRHVEEIAWSPDSRAIAFTHMPTPGADDWTKADLAEVDVASGTVKPIAATNAAESQPVYSPDGKYLAFTRTSDPPRWAEDERVVLLNRETGESRTLPATYDEQPMLLGFTANGSRLLFPNPGIRIPASIRSPWMARPKPSSSRQRE